MQSSALKISHVRKINILRAHNVLCQKFAVVCQKFSPRTWLAGVIASQQIYMFLGNQHTGLSTKKIFQDNFFQHYSEQIILTK